jgi:hypothetical protein
MFRQVQDMIRDDGEFQCWMESNSNVFFGSELFDNALYKVIHNVYWRLNKSLEKLDKTNDFISYCSIGDDYVDLNVTARKSISKELYYKTFPMMVEGDQKFKDWVESLEELNGLDLINKVLHECEKNTHRTSQDVFSATYRNEYAGVKVLADRLSLDECNRIVNEIKAGNGKNIKSMEFLMSLVMRNKEN